MRSREMSLEISGRRHLLQTAPRPPQEQPHQQSQPGKHEGRLDTDVVIVLGVVLCLLIVAVWVHSVLRCILRRNRRLAFEAAPIPVDGPQHGNTAGPTMSADGLDAKTIDMLPIVTASSEFETGRLSVSTMTTGFEQMPSPVVVPATECAVCLQEFDPGEAVKLLPNCGHSFHVHCIAGWLRIHGSCPVCRHGVLEPPSPRWSTSSSTMDAEAISTSRSMAVTPSGSSGFFILSSPVMQQFQHDFQLRAGAAAAAALAERSPSSLYSMFAADGGRAANFVQFFSTEHNRPPPRVQTFE